MIEVDVVVRSDAPDKWGGDSLQVQEYARALDGVADLRVLPFSPRLAYRPGAVVHIVNMDRPFDLLRAAGRARGHRLVISPIHHDLAAVRRMRGAERGAGARSVVGRLLPEAGRELLAYGARTARASATEAVRALAWAAPRATGVWRRVGRALDRADAVALLAPGEGRSIARDTGWGAANGAMVPNGAPAPDPSGTPDVPWHERTGIAVVGRVEPRKRVLELARRAHEREVPLTVAGAVNAGTGGYARDFEALARTSPWVTWLGALPHAETVALLRRVRVLANASWVEVQSLVELEAATSGAYVVSCGTGNSADWLPGHVRELRDDDVDGLLDAATELAARDRGPGSPAYDWTWRRSAEELLALYRGAGPDLGTPRPVDTPRD